MKNGGGGYSKIAVLIVVLVVIIAAAVVLVFTIFKNKDFSTDDKNAAITIGDVVITHDMLDEYTENLKKYKEQAERDKTYFADPDDKRSIKDMARDELIMYAALIYERNTECGDITDEFYTKDLQKADLSNIKVATVRGNTSVLQQLFIECLLPRTFYYRVGFNFGINITQEVYDRAKTTLTEKYLPLFEQGKSQDEINKIINADKGSGITSEYTKGIYPFADIRKEESDIEQLSIDTGVLINPWNKAINLSKVGDHTNVFASTDGWLEIIRLEEIQTACTGCGPYNSYSIFLEKIKEQYDKNN